MKKAIAFGLLLLTACSSPKKSAETSTSIDSVSQVSPVSATTATAEMPDTAMFSPDNFVIIPGQQVGNITATSTEAKLKSMLGDEVVGRDTIWGPEGSFVLGTVVFAGTPDQVFIAWKDTLHAATPDYVVIRPSNKKPGTGGMVTQWIVPDGPTIGTTLKEVQQINGRPFSISGFGWDYGGTLYDAKGGTLGGNGQRGYLSLQFGYDSNSPKAEKLAQKVSGDRTFMSNNLAMQQLNPTVTEMVVTFK